MTEVTATYQHRRGQFNNIKNLVPKAGEIILEVDGGNNPIAFRIGDGITQYQGLAKEVKLEDKNNPSNKISDFSLSGTTLKITMLDGVVFSEDISSLLFDGNYNSLSNKPFIPNDLSDLLEDTSHRSVTDAQINTWNNKSNFSGNYNDLNGKPNLNQYATKTYVQNIVGYFDISKTAPFTVTNTDINKVIKVTSTTNQDEITIDDTSGFTENDFIEILFWSKSTPDDIIDISFSNVTVLNPDRTRMTELGQSVLIEYTNNTFIIKGYRV